MLMAVCHSDETGWTQVEDLDHVSDLRIQEGKLLWAEADIGSLTELDIATIAQEFDLHPLAVEDAMSKRERPKLEVFADHHLFVVFHQLDERDDHLEAVQIACFVGEGYVLTLHAGAQRTLAEVRKRWESDDDPSVRRGRTYLMHLMLDVIVDDYQAIAEKLDDTIEQIEDLTLLSVELPEERMERAAEAEAQRQLYSLKQQTARFRRYALPMGRILHDVIDGPQGSPFFREETVVLFRDVQDHLLRISDQIRSIDDLTDAVLELRRSEQAASLNEINKKLTAWAAIIAVPTLISSTYGMNFKLVPQDQTLLGFWFALGLMASAGVSLFVFFKRKGWL